MGLHILYWTILVGYMVLVLCIGFMPKKRTAKDHSNYFLSGCSFPRWLAGTPVVATLFTANACSFLDQTGALNYRIFF